MDGLLLLERVGAAARQSARARQPLVARLLCNTGTNAADPPESAAAAPGAAGAEIRFTPVSLPPMVIVGADAASPEPTAPGLLAHMTSHQVWVQEQAAVAALAAVFDSVWQSAGPAKPARKQPGGGARPSAADMILVRLLADGLTYPAIARRLGVSSRTIDRRVAALLVRLKAGSRFEVVREATLSGWL